MSKEEFIADVTDAASTYRKKYPCLRFGQAIFNYVDKNYGHVARQVQFQDGIDCFYVDENIADFLDACWNRISLTIKED